MTASGTYAFVPSELQANAFMSIRTLHEGSGAKESKYVVYCARNTVNGKRYIGATTQGLTRRRSAHIATALGGKGWRFHAALRKYGIEKFVWTILYACSSYDEAFEIEEREIEKFAPEYNITKGGKGRRASTSAITRYKLRLAHLGRKQSQDSINKRRMALLGRPRSEETKRKITETKRSHPDRCNGPLGLKRSDDEIRRSAEKRMKRIICIDDGVIHRSIKDAALYYGMHSAANIRRALFINGTSSGRRFEYL